jgi:hypothetical protein
MSDPLEQLDRFRSGIDAQGAPMLSAAEVRRQGDRMRRRTTALRTGVAALALAVAAVPVAVSLGRGGDDGPKPTTHDPNEVVDTIGDVNLLGDADTVAYDVYHWKRTATVAGDGALAGNVCAPGTLTDLGATSTYRRDWTLADANGPLQGAGAADQLSEAVGGYDSPQAARDAVERIAGAIARCGSTMQPGQHYNANRPRLVDTGLPDDESMLIESNYVPDPARPEEGTFVETGLVARGDRVGVLTMVISGGQDFNVETPPVQAMLQMVADRLVAGPTSLTPSMLVTAGDIPFEKGLSWYQSYTGPDETQAPFSVCAQPLVSVGAKDTVQRDFRAASGETGDATDAYVDESIGDFGTTTAAIDAVETIARWYATCRPTGSDHYTVLSPWADVPTEPHAFAQTMIATYGPADAVPGTPYDVSGRSDLSWYLDVTIVRDGTRVAVLTQNVLMVEYDRTFLTTTAQYLPAALRRLRGEGAAPDTGAGPGAAPTATTAAGGVPTTIPDDFPLDAGWESLSPESADSVVAPSRTTAPIELATPCDRPFAWPAHEDRMVAGFHNPEDGRDRTLVTFADADAAAAATKALVDYYRACPQHASQPDGYVAHYEVARSTASGDSWHISQYDTVNGSPALGAQAIHVIRVGLAVLVLSWGGEGGADAMPTYFRGMDEQAARPIAALCRFTVDGC